MYSEDEKNIVRKLTDTVLWRGLQWFGVLTLLSLAVNGFTGYFKIGFDDTDGEARSGMGVRIDNLTKCQYLYTPEGGLTPRLKIDGSQICK